MYEPIRGGTRGGQAEFKWSDVSADKDREHYLGHSINAPTGRWQKNKDVHWYNRDKEQTESERDAEKRKIKEAEAEALAAVLGFSPANLAEKKEGQSSNNAIGELDPAEVEQRRREKEERRQRKLEKRMRKEEHRRKKAKQRERGQDRSRSRIRSLSTGPGDAKGHERTRRRSSPSRSRSPPRRRYDDVGGQRSAMYREDRHPPPARQRRHSQSRSRSPVNRRYGSRERRRRETEPTARYDDRLERYR